MFTRFQNLFLRASDWVCDGCQCHIHTHRHRVMQPNRIASHTVHKAVNDSKWRIHWHWYYNCTGSVQMRETAFGGNKSTKSPSAFSIQNKKGWTHSLARSFYALCQRPRTLDCVRVLFSFFFWISIALKSFGYGICVSYRTEREFIAVWWCVVRKCDLRNVKICCDTENRAVHALCIRGIVIECAVVSMVFTKVVSDAT